MVLEGKRAGLEAIFQTEFVLDKRSHAREVTGPNYFYSVWQYIYKEV